MHSFGHTFAHSSHPMHLYQSITCCPRNDCGSSIFSYGYSRVTGGRPPGMSRLISGVVWRVCFIVARSGRRYVPRGRFRGPVTSMRSDGSYFIRIVPAKVRELPLRRVDEAALLRLDPPAALRLDLRAELQEPVDQGLRAHGTPGDEDVRRDERVRALDDAVRIVVGTAADRALPHRDDPLRLRHLFVQAADRRAELQGDRPVQEEDVDLAGGRTVDDAEPLRVVPRVARRRHLDRAAHDPEVERPRAVPLGPVQELVDDALHDQLARAGPGRPSEVVVDPRHELLRAKADDVRLFAARHHRNPPGRTRYWSE